MHTGCSGVEECLTGIRTNDYVRTTNRGRDDFLLLGGGNKDHVTELNGGGGGPRISELEGKGALITSAGRVVFPPLFFSSRNKNLSKRLQKQKQKKATSTYLSYLPPSNNRPPCPL